MSQTPFSYFIRTALIAIFVMCSGACAAPQQNKFTDADYGSPPSNYKTVAREYLMHALKDPYSAHITIPDQTPQKQPGLISGGGFKWVPCYTVRAIVNAKNSFGAYTGESPIIIYIYKGRAVNAVGL